jgi:tRNA (guanine37-N1)-methyltransferase
MRFDVLTLFPDAVNQYLSTSILGHAQQKGLIDSHVWNIRGYAHDKHHTVDDTPYGGGAGMVMKIEPIDHALQTVREDTGNKGQGTKKSIIVLSARGAQFTQAKAEEYAKLDQLILISGRYEGIDQRVADHLADEEIAIGPYVLAGGELAALVVIEASARLLPGVLGNPESLIEESFSTNYQPPTTNSVEYPQYTKPDTYKGWRVPEVLLSGNHAAIRQWRMHHSGTTGNS